MDKIFKALQNDVAFAYSVEYDDVANMQIVLRAHGYTHSHNFACEVIDHALMQS